MRHRIPTALGTVAVASLVLTGCGGAADASDGDDVIRFATLPVDDDPQAATPVEALAELLEAETGMTVEITDVPSYSAVIEAVRAGHEDIGIMSGFPSALAVNTGEVDALIAWPGSDDPVSTCLVLADSPLQTLSDITPDTVVAFADPASSSGFFMPTHMLHEVGLVAGDDFEQLFSGGHDRSFMALAQGQADVACTSTIFPAMAGQGSEMFPFDEGETRSLGESIGTPVSLALLGNQSMSQAKREAILEAFPQVFSLENADVLSVYADVLEMGAEPMIEPDRAVFRPFVEIAAVADVDISDLE